jgi:hypothetical protein
VKIVDGIMPNSATFTMTSTDGSFTAGSTNSNSSSDVEESEMTTLQQLIGEDADIVLPGDFVRREDDCEGSFLYFVLGVLEADDIIFVVRLKEDEGSLQESDCFADDLGRYVLARRGNGPTQQSDAILRKMFFGGV